MFQSSFRTKNNFPQKQKGFTLIEAIVATALFAFAMVSIINVYLSTVRINRRTELISTASQNVRYISEYLSKEIRNGLINYTGPASSPCTLPPFSSPSNTFSMINLDLWLIKNSFSAVKVNTSDVQITSLNFYVQPTSDPYLSSLKTQPRVSVIGSLKAISGPQDNVTMPIETSISLPLYDLP